MFFDGSFWECFRFCWFCGTLFRSQIKNGGPVTVTHRNITRYFMSIPESSYATCKRAMAKGGDVFVLDMGDPVKILDLKLMG